MDGMIHVNAFKDRDPCLKNHSYHYEVECIEIAVWYFQATPNCNRGWVLGYLYNESKQEP